jgi:methionyl-tRNA formyltransferase
MKIFLCGQAAFGAAVLELCLKMGHEVVGVCSPEKAKSDPTGQKTDRVTYQARERGIPWLPAGGLSAKTLPAGVDLIVTAHSHDFIGRATRLRARVGAIGYHPSLLPRHRGRDAVRWAIRMREPVTGGTIYWLSDMVDGGDIAAQGFCHIRPDDTAEELWRRELFPMGVRLFKRVLDDLAAKRIVRIPQDPKLATWEPAIEGAPRLRRPDLPLLTDGRTPAPIDDYAVVVEGD